MDSHNLDMSDVWVKKEMEEDNNHLKTGRIQFDGAEDLKTAGFWAEHEFKDESEQTLI